MKSLCENYLETVTTQGKSQKTFNAEAQRMQRAAEFKTAVLLIFSAPLR